MESKRTLGRTLQQEKKAKARRRALETLRNYHANINHDRQRPRDPLPLITWSGPRALAR